MFHIIVNPTGASGRTGKYWKKLAPLFEGAEIEVHYSTPGHSIEQICRELTDTGDGEGAGKSTDLVYLVIVGGDGSINEAINGIQDFKRARVALIPSGSGNDLARDLGLPTNDRKLVDTILAAKVQHHLDVGEVIYHDDAPVTANANAHDGAPVTVNPNAPDRAAGSTHRFIVSSGIGFDAAVCEAVANAPLKGILNKIYLGKLIYLAQALRLIFSNEASEGTIRAEESAAEVFASSATEAAAAKDRVLNAGGELRINRLTFAAAMNHRFEGGGFMFAPKAKATDGQLNLCVLHDIRVPAFFRLFPQAYSGAHVRHTQYVAMLESPSFRVQTRDPMWVHCDGEVSRQSRDVSFRTTGDKLLMIV